MLRAAPSLQESLRKFDDVVAAAKAEGVAVRGYVSCVVGCPIQVRGAGAANTCCSPVLSAGSSRLACRAATQPAASGGSGPSGAGACHNQPELPQPTFPSRAMCGQKMQRAWRWHCTKWGAMRCRWAIRSEWALPLPVGGRRDRCWLCVRALCPSPSLVAALYHAPATRCVLSYLLYCHLLPGCYGKT